VTIAVPARLFLAAGLFLPGIVILLPSSEPGHSQDFVAYPQHVRISRWIGKAASSFLTEGTFLTQLSAAVSDNPCMTLPRQVVPGRDYMVTRRCSERRFFLRPDQETSNAFVYCLILAATRAKVEVTFSTAMSNHHHTSIHDPDGNFPIFTEHFHGLLARCQNAYLGRFEGFWSSEPTSVVHLVEPNDILDKMTYAFTNPAAADLVDTVEEWPGVTTFQATITGGHITATRPKHFFRDDGDSRQVP
jgi:REP element-mobilizing transposase RayT